MNKRATANWAEYGNLISFVPAKKESSNPGTEYPESGQAESQKLSGNEAKNFYEDLLSESSAKEGTRTRKKKHLVKTAVKNQREANKNINNDGDSLDSTNVCYSEQCTAERNSDKEEKTMLFHSQAGDIKLLKKLFKKTPDININYQDHFGWTALMCGAVSGHTNIVDYLLRQGANRFIRDSQHKTVCELTAAKGDKEMMERIERFAERNDTKEGEKKMDVFYCDKCKTSFKETSLKEHQTSTLHLFNMNLKPNIDTFMIPRSNIGYRLMKQSGWDGERGLGPHGKGQRLPVKTVLKRNRFCLGSELENKKKKITHFGPYDTSATASVSCGSKRVVSAATSSRRERKKREKKEKEWERNLRQSMDF